MLPISPIEHKRDVLEFWKNKDNRFYRLDELLDYSKPDLASVLRFEHVGVPARALLPRKEKLAEMCVHLIKHAHYSYGVFKYDHKKIKEEFAEAVITQKRNFSTTNEKVKNFLVDASFLPEDMMLVISTLPIEIAYMSNFAKFTSCMTIKKASMDEILRNRALALAPGSIIAYAYRASEPREKYWRMLMHVPLEDIDKGKLSAVMFMRQYPRSHVLALLTKELIEGITGVKLRRPRDWWQEGIFVVLKTNRVQYPPYIDPFDLRVSREIKNTLDNPVKYTFQLY